MRPDVYLYEQKDEKHLLYLGEYSTLDGLKVFNDDLKVELLHAEASYYNKLGWATEKDLPGWGNVKEVKLFFEKEDIDLLQLKLKIEGIDWLETHDDGECHFIFHHKKDLMEVLSRVSPTIHQSAIAASIFKHPGKYVKIGSSGKIHIYHTFDQYLDDDSGI